MCQEASPEDRGDMEKWEGYYIAARSMAIGAVIGAVAGKLVDMPVSETAVIGAVVGLVTHPRELHPEEDYSPDTM